MGVGPCRGSTQSASSEPLVTKNLGSNVRRFVRLHADPPGQLDHRALRERCKRTSFRDLPSLRQATPADLHGQRGAIFRHPLEKRRCGASWQKGAGLWQVVTGSDRAHELQRPACRPEATRQGTYWRVGAWPVTFKLLARASEGRPAPKRVPAEPGAQRCRTDNAWPDRRWSSGNSGTSCRPVPPAFRRGFRRRP